MTGAAVLDASAVLAVLLNEPRPKLPLDAAKWGRCSAVNYAETVSRLIDRGFQPEQVQTMFDAFPVTVIPFDRELAFAAGLLRRETRAFGLSLGDRACLALAQRDTLPVLTADRRWQELNIGIDIRFIR